MTKTRLVEANIFFSIFGTCTCQKIKKNISIPHLKTAFELSRIEKALITNMMVWDGVDGLG